jgi:hypothetical protein
VDTLFGENIVPIQGYEHVKDMRDPGQTSSLQRGKACAWKWNQNRLEMAATSENNNR